MWQLHFSDDFYKNVRENNDVRQNVNHWRLSKSIVTMMSKRMIIVSINLYYIIYLYYIIQYKLCNQFLMYTIVSWPTK